MSQVRTFDDVLRLKYESWIMVKTDDTADVSVFAYLLWLSCILCTWIYFMELHLIEAIKRTKERCTELEKLQAHFQIVIFRNFCNRFG